MTETRASASTRAARVDYAALYDAHPEYVARRCAGSLAQAQVDLEVRAFKLPHLLRVWPAGEGLPASVLEIGCATGELIAAFPTAPRGRRVGVDISAENIAVAAARFPAVDFRCGDFRSAFTGAVRFDVVVLSDVLEHVPDDAGFLRDAARLGRTLLVNLPLEDNWLNRGRNYGPDDASGHLRRYSLDAGRALFARAGLEIVAEARVWVHETPAEPERRALRKARLGAEYAGGPLGRTLRRAVFGAATALPPLGRRLFASNLFAAARVRPGG